MVGVEIAAEVSSLGVSFAKQIAIPLWRTTDSGECMCVYPFRQSDREGDMRVAQARLCLGLKSLESKDQVDSPDRMCR